MRVIEFPICPKNACCGACFFKCVSCCLFSLAPVVVPICSSHVASIWAVCGFQFEPNSTSQPHLRDALASLSPLSPLSLLSPLHPHATQNKPKNSPEYKTNGSFDLSNSSLLPAPKLAFGMDPFRPPKSTTTTVEGRVKMRVNKGGPSGAFGS